MWMWHHEKSNKCGSCTSYRLWMHHYITQRMSNAWEYAQCPSVLHCVHSLVADLTLTALVVAAKSLVSLLSLVACYWRSGWEHFSSNNRQTVTDRPGMKMQLFLFALVTMVIGSKIVFYSSNQPAMFFSTRFNRRQNYDVKFRLYPYTT